MQVAPPLRGKFTLVDGLPDWLLKDENEKPIKRLRASPAGLLGTAIGLGLAGAELASHHQQFTLTNLVACMVVSDILQRVGIRSFRSAAVLCAGAGPLDCVSVSVRFMRSAVSLESARVRTGFAFRSLLHVL